MAYSRTSSWTNLLIIMNLLQKLILYTWQSNGWNGWGEQKCTGRNHLNPASYKLKATTSSSFQNPTVLNPKQETAEAPEDFIPKGIPRSSQGIYPTGEKWRVQVGAWRGGRHGLLGPSPFSREQCDVCSKETIFNAVRVPPSPVRGWGASHPRKALSSSPQCTFPLSFPSLLPGIHPSSKLLALPSDTSKPTQGPLRVSSGPCKEGRTEP